MCETPVPTSGLGPWTRVKLGLEQRRESAHRLVKEFEVANVRVSMSGTCEFQEVWKGFELRAAAGGCTAGAPVVLSGLGATP